MTQKLIETLSVDLGDRSYDIAIGPNVLASLGQRVRDIAPKARIAVITDENVHELHGEAIATALRGSHTHVIVRPAGESQKSMANLEEILDELVHAQDLTDLICLSLLAEASSETSQVSRRPSTNVACRFVQVPTTLLAQVDSSVGGKTAINNRFGKNLVGAFYQPEQVVADTELLKTLPERELKAGYAEVLKYGLLGDADFFEELDAGLGERYSGPG